MASNVVNTQMHWNDSSNNLEKALLKHKKNCLAYKWMHEQECFRYYKRNKILNIISIIVTFIVGLTSIITDNLLIDLHLDEFKFIINSIITPFFLFMVSFINGIQQNSKFEQQAEHHNLANIRYNALYSNIDRMLTINKEDRQEPVDYFKWVNDQYDNLGLSSPIICTKIKEQFIKKFGCTLEQIDLDNYNKDNVNIQTDSVINIDTLQDKGKNNNHLNLETERSKYELERFMMESFI